MEISRNAVEVARSHLRGPVHQGPLTDDVFPGQRFDIVCAWEVIEHVSDLPQFVAALFNRLKPGGHLFLSTPNYDSGWIWGTFEKDRCGMPPVHVTFWNRRSIRRYLSACGFSEIGVWRYSIPMGAAIDSGMPLSRLLVTIDATLRPSQRQTLFVHARRRP